jgi:outer membrane usher protein
MTPASNGSTYRLRAPRSCRTSCVFAKQEPFTPCHRISSNASLYATGYQSAQGVHNTGFFVGLSLAFGGGRSVNTGVEGSGRQTSAYAEVSEQGEQRPGALSWRARAESADGGRFGAEASYVTSFARAGIVAQHLLSGSDVQAHVEGAVVLLGGRPLFSNRIDDAFAVIETGQPHVPVTFENRPAGETDRSGRLVAPYLSAYNDNNIAIDPSALSGDLTVEDPHRIVTPGRGAGAIVRFKVRPMAPGALVTLRDEAGAILPVGAAGWVNADHSRAFVVGYDGQAYVESARNSEILHLVLPDGHACSASLEGDGRAAHARACL